MIPRILITDNNRNRLEEKLLNSGIITQHLIKPVSLKELSNAIISKPFSVNELIGKIDELLINEQYA